MKPSLLVVLAACSPEPKKDEPRTYTERRGNAIVQHVNERKDPETGEVKQEELPPAKPVEKRTLHLGETKVDANVEDSRAIPLTSVVEIRTWADETIKGVLLDENDDGYFVRTDDGKSVLVRRPRVMAIRVLPKPSRD